MGGSLPVLRDVGHDCVKPGRNPLILRVETLSLAGFAREVGMAAGVADHRPFDRFDRACG